MQLAKWIQWLEGNESVDFFAGLVIIPLFSSHACVLMFQRAWDFMTLFLVSNVLQPHD
jgi:hypothetical protein